MPPRPAVAAVLALLLFAGRHAHAQVTAVRGEVVALECLRTEGDAGRGDGHGAHAMARARDGAVMAVLADDGPYVIVGDYTANTNAKLLDFVAKRVEAKGVIGERDGQKTIRVAAMMVLDDSPARP